MLVNLKEILKIAEEEKNAVGMFNATGFDSLQAVIAAAEELNKPGGSGVSEEGFKKAIANGIRKINYYSYMSKTGYMAAKDVIANGKTSYLHDIEYAAMKQDAKNALKIFSMV